MLATESDQFLIQNPHIQLPAKNPVDDNLKHNRELIEIQLCSTVLSFKLLMQVVFQKERDLKTTVMIHL